MILKNYFEMDASHQMAFRMGQQFEQEQMGAEMKLSIMLETDQNMGDHGERVQVAVEYVPGETVEDLVDRIGADHGPFVVNQRRSLGKFDVVEIRVIE